MKIFEQIINARLRKIIIITPNQCGFIKGKGMMDTIHALWLLLEKHHEKNKPVHMAFLNLEKCLTVCHMSLYGTLFDRIMSLRNMSVGPNTLPQHHQCGLMHCRNIAAIHDQGQCTSRIGSVTLAY